MSENTIDKHKLWEKGTTLSITISPGLRNQFLTTDPYTERKSSFIDAWELTLIEKLRGCNYKLWLEISKNGLLHWHGTLRVLDAPLLAHSIAQLKYVLNDVNVDVDTIDDLDTWLAYCTKDHSTMKTVIEGPQRKTNINDFFKSRKVKGHGASKRSTRTFE